ncbi:MAG: HAD-IA family hydrolase [Rhodospirillales bacterium]|nr:HAD-IA family hydrolase [Rhodospirillales bacterium]
MTLRAIIFDVDGTLAETEEAHRHAFNEAFRDAGLDWRWDRDLYAELLAVAGGRERLRHYIARHRPDANLQESDIARLHHAKTAIYQGFITEGRIELRPGVEQILRTARKGGLRLAIATTTTRGNVLGLLAATLGTDSARWFEVIGAGEDSPAKKPDPGVYRHVVAALDMAPFDCLAIEDSAIGLAAASGAGIPTLVAPSVYTRGETFTGAAAVVEDLAAVTLADLRRWHAAATRPVTA